MTPSELQLLKNNLLRWQAACAKLERLLKEEPNEKFDDQRREELEFRQAQVKVWAYQLRQAGETTGEDDPGSISASSKAKTKQRASA